MEAIISLLIWIIIIAKCRTSVMIIIEYKKTKVHKVFSILKNETIFLVADCLYLPSE